MDDLTLTHTFAAAQVPHTHSMSCDCATTGTQLTFKEFSSALTNNSTLPAGNYYLADDVILTDTLKISGIVNLCLNGHKLTAAANKRVIQLDDGVTLNLCDCRQGEEGVSNTVTCAGNNTSGTVDSGVITGGDSRTQSLTTKHGGGVLITGDGAAFNMYGGAVSGNTGEGTGGVRVSNGTFTMYGGEISYNCAAGASAGGVIVSAGASFTMQGGTIKNNAALAGHGGGVFINGGTVTMTGGMITNNSVNTGDHGGGVYLGTGTFNISGNPIVSGNTRGGTTDNVELASGRVVNITGAFTSGASIGITTETGPTTGNPVAITGANNDNAYAAYFMSDNASFTVYDDGTTNKTVKLRAPLTKLPTPTGLEWATGTDPFMASWNAVTNASGYSIQLYKDGTSSANKVGDEIPATGTELELFSTLAAHGLGTYYFTVRATGDGLSYSDSDASSVVGVGVTYVGPTLGNNGLYVYGNGIPLYISEETPSSGVATTYVCTGGYYGTTNSLLVTSWASNHTNDSHYVYGGYASGSHTANTHIYMNGGSVRYLYGGNKGESTGTHLLNGSTNIDISGGTVVWYIYGGGDMRTTGVSGSTNVTVSGTADIGFIVGGGGAIGVNTNVTIEGGTVRYTVIGGGWDGGDTVAGNSNVVISGGSIYTDTDRDVCILGGGFNSTATVMGNSSVTISGGTIGTTDTRNTVKVTGGGGYASTGTATVTVTGGTINASIVGGGTVNGNAAVILSGGTVMGNVSATDDKTKVTGACTISVSNTAIVHGTIDLTGTSNYRVDITGALTGGATQVFELNRPSSTNVGTVVAHAAASVNADATKFTLVDSASISYPLTVKVNAGGGSDIVVAVPDTPVSFVSLTANGSGSASTTELTITLNTDVTLTSADVTVIGADGGTLTRIGAGTYTLGISNISVNDGGYVTVILDKANYALTPESKTATVRVYTPPLVFTDSGAYDVPAGTFGVAITPIDVSGGVSGGKEPYTFSFESGAPSWLSISNSGVISGTRPDIAQAETIAFVKVTDSTLPTAAAKIIEIDIGAVTPIPAAPSITTEPVSQTIAEGQTATFTVAATGYPAPEYQWLISTDNGASWDDVSDGTGGTSASYTTPTATTAMNGYQYSCLIYNRENIVASSDVTLTVTANPPASGNTVSGITAGQTFTSGDTVTFTVSGGGMNNQSPKAGDNRWLPTYWETNPSGNFNSGYTRSFSTNGMSLGQHTLTVTFTQQSYNGTAWVNTGVTDTKTVSYTITTVAKNEIAAPKTGDSANVYLYGAMMLIASGGMILIMKLRKSKHKA